MDCHITIENHEIHNQNSMRMLNKQWNLYDLKETNMSNIAPTIQPQKINVLNKTIAPRI
jgi:hypothetical protein